MPAILTPTYLNRPKVDYPYFDESLREPRLMVPGQKPVGAVRIDTSNRLANDLDVCLVPTPSMSLMRSLVVPSKAIAGQGLDWTSSGAGAKVGVGTGKYGAVSDGTAYWSSLYWYAPDSGGAADESFTIAMGVTFASVAGTLKGVWSWATSAASAEPQWLLQQNSTDLRMYIGSYTNIATVDAGVTYHILLSYQREEDRLMCVVNRAAPTYIARAAYSKHTTDEYMYLLSGYNGQAPATMEYFYIWRKSAPGRKMYYQEACNFQSDPYQFLIPA